MVFGLRVIRLDKARPASLADTVRRNLVFLIPGANVVAIFMEALTITRDPQGHRLGDRVAQTQVVVGYGARDLVRFLGTWSADLFSRPVVTGPRPGRRPVRPA